MNHQAMSRERLHELLETYGADPRRWPAPEREAAAALLRAAPSGSELWRQAAALDALLDRLPAAEPEADLRSAIFAALPAQPPASGWSQALSEFLASIGGLRLAGPALAIALAGGVAAGLLIETGDALTAPTAEGEDLLALAQLEEPAWSDSAEGEAP